MHFNRSYSVLLLIRSQSCSRRISPQRSASTIQCTRSEEVLTRIRPNTERALRCFERHFTDARAISAEKIETKSQQQERYRIGYISTGRVQDFTLTFIYSTTGRWIIQPELPNQLP